MKNQKQIFTMKDANGVEQRFTTNEKGHYVPIVEEKEPVKKAVLSPDEAREILGLSRNSFMNLLYSGELKGVKAGRRWLIPSQAIDCFLGLSN